MSFEEARLAAYEASGLSPREVFELAQAQRDGRMILLPRPEANTCGSCAHWVRKSGTRYGLCGDVRTMCTYAKRQACKRYEPQIETFVRFGHNVRQAMLRTFCKER